MLKVLRVKFPSNKKNQEPFHLCRALDISGCHLKCIKSLVFIYIGRFAKQNARIVTLIAMYDKISIRMIGLTVMSSLSITGLKKLITIKYHQFFLEEAPQA